MAAPSLGTCGMIMMILNGVLSTSLLVAGKMMQDIDWPFFRTLGCSSCTLFVLISARIIFTRTTLPDETQLTWLAFRGFFGALSTFFQLLAVRCGTAPGDIAALASVNTVFAAVFGRIVLGESLLLLQGIALVCSATGSVLISRPRFLFGAHAADTAEEGTVWIGFIMAVAAGMAQAWVAISARKANKCPVLVLSLSPAFFLMAMFMLLPATPLVSESSMDRLLEAPGTTTLFVALFLVMQIGAVGSNSAGASWCPAAVSATTSTCSKMVSGYIAQALLFGKAPGALTLCGAAIMMVAVLIMALARLPQLNRSASGSMIDPASQESAGVQTAEFIEEQVDDTFPATSTSLEDAETESLASFIAAEFGTVSPHEKEIRHRRVHSNQPPTIVDFVAKQKAASAATRKADFAQKEAERLKKESERLNKEAKLAKQKAQRVAKEKAEFAQKEAERVDKQEAQQIGAASFVSVVAV